MFPSAALRRLGGWLALLASLSSAIVPIMGHALQAVQGGGSVEVCTASGSKWLPLAEGQFQVPADPGPAEASSHDGHCALCSAAGAALFLAAGFEARTGPPRAAFELPNADEAAPLGRDPWRTGRPRGPPLQD